MFPDRVGKLVLDGMEYARDGWKPYTWGTTSLDNVTNAFEDGFVGECVKAGPSSCALVTKAVAAEDDEFYLDAHQSLLSRLHDLFEGLVDRPIPGISKYGPGIVTYEYLTSWLYGVMYKPGDWKASAKLLAELEQGNATLALEAINESQWSYKLEMNGTDPTTGELSPLVICVSPVESFGLVATLSY
jgi:hypothetical protein